MKGNARKCYISVLICVFSFIPSAGFAHNKVVVIPMSGDDLKPLQNIVTVAKANGDFNNPVAAINSITDASASNPYLLVIAPGIYTLASQLVMKEYVDISGSGEAVTKLIGAITGANIEASAIVKGANNSGLTDLTIENTVVGGANAVGIYNSPASPTLSDLTINVSGGSANNVGIQNVTSSSPMMNNLTLSISGGTQAYGVVALSSSSLLSNSIISVNGASSNFGVYLFNTTLPSLMMENLIISVSGGAIAYGVTDSAGSSMVNLTISATGSAINYGVYTSGTSQMSGLIISAKGGSGTNYGVASIQGSPIIRNSYLDGSDFGIYNFTNGIPNVSHSTVINGANNTSSICAFVDDGAGNALDASCQ